MKSSQTIKTAFILYQVGTYHYARLEALSTKVSLHVVPLSSHSFQREWQVNSHPEHRPLFADVGKEQTKSVLSALVRKLEEINPDIVVISGYFYPAMREAARWAKRNGCGTILLSESNYYDKKRYFPSEFIKGAWLRKHFDACFVGGARAQLYHEYLGFPPHRIWTGYDVVDNLYFQRKSLEAKKRLSKVKEDMGLPDKFFLYVGRLSAEKNLERLLKSFAMLSCEPKAKNWHLVITGSGPREKMLREMCIREGMQQIIWTGFQQLDLLPSIYSCASAFVLPSVTEPWGLVVNEAMACGLPILASYRCGSVLDLVKHGENGWIFDPYSEQSMREAMFSANEKEDNLPLMGARSLDIIKFFTQETFAVSLADCIASISSIQRP